MSTSDNCKDGASQSNCNDGVCEVNDMLQNMSADNEDVVSICANCGKEGSSDSMNTCNKCKEVTYCNAACKKKHRSKHKKACDRRVAELHDKELFKQPPPKEDCPICFVRLPTLKSGTKYQSCCGKTICSGCSYAPVYDNQGNKVDEKKCAFCRVPTPTSHEEVVEREKKRLADNDPIAVFNTGCYYYYGRHGLTQDMDKALELYHRAAELGFAESYLNIGIAYQRGNRVKVDEKKAIYYYEQAAIGGEVAARFNLGINEEIAGNIDKALKHYMIAVKGGHSKSLKRIKDLYSNEKATKDDYMKALQSYQTYLGEIKSVQRDKAAAADEKYHYF